MSHGTKSTVQIIREFRLSVFRLSVVHRILFSKAKPESLVETSHMKSIPSVRPLCPYKILFLLVSLLGSSCALVRVTDLVTFSTFSLEEKITFSHIEKSQNGASYELLTEKSSCFFWRDSSQSCDR